jgi:hypothetical protein
VKRSRDVTFDEDSLYDLENPFLPELKDRVPEFIKPQNIIELQEIRKDVSQEKDKEEDKAKDIKILTPTKSSTLINLGKKLIQELEQVTTYYPMPKPKELEVEIKNEESEVIETIPLPNNAGAEQSVSAPREIIRDMGEVNILEGKRTRKPSLRALGFVI